MDAARDLVNHGLTARGGPTAYGEFRWVRPGENQALAEASAAVKPAWMNQAASRRLSESWLGPRRYCGTLPVCRHGAARDHQPAVGFGGIARGMILAECVPMLRRPPK